MELVRGRPLRDELNLWGPIEWGDVVRIARDLLGALAYAHGLGILHRDLKPENVMMLDGSGIKILDLGVARVEEASSLTSTGEVLGTLRYMAPEQIEAETPDARTDLFSVGVILFECLTGQMPYGPTNLTRRVDDLEPRLRAVQPGPPDELIALVRDLMEPDRERRVPSAALGMERAQALLSRPA
jgi:serine/threonine-protein kinase